MTQHNPNFDPYNLQGQYAGFVTRLIAFLLDIVILTAIYGVTISAAQLITEFFSLDLKDFITTHTWLGMLTVAVSLLFPVAYYVFFWVLIGQTPGKAFMGVRIFGINGGRIGLAQAMLRYVGYFLSTALFFAGFWWVLIDNRRQGLHDKLARTVVVYSWEARIHRLVVRRAQLDRPRTEQQRPT